MTRQEFLEEIRRSLQGEISQAQVSEHLLYYDHYMMEEVAKGKSEEEVIAELGNPRLIAKTLIDTGNQTTAYEEYDSRQSEVQQEKGSFQQHFLSGSLWVRLATIVVAILVFVLVISFVISLLPVLLVLVILIWAFSFLFRR
ncbi:hypothetical protein FACS1894111_13210 [Clostridia bacterium]|nr:hypothetical protein FACS1894111_13210 [Clostridia bacterium]